MNPVAKLGSSSFCIYETTFLNLKVKYADVEGTNMYHVKSFVDSYNAANEEPIVEFYKFIQYDNENRYIPKYLERFSHYMPHPSKGCGSSSNSNDLFDSNNHWNIPNVIVYCYSNVDNTRGYWVRAEILSRYAQKGNIDFLLSWSIC